MSSVEGPAQRNESAARWQRIRALFAELVELSPPTRAVALARACGADAELRRELEALLEAAERADDFLVRTPALLEQAAPGPEVAGTQLGSLRLGPALAPGRVGRVHRAQAQHGQEIALRLVPIGAGAAAPLQRLMHSAGKLDTLVHAGLARVLETGIGASPERAQLSTVYFASEFVAAGTPLADFADRGRLGVRERLALFQEACSAVAHAHRHGVPHGNLSAANVLVDVRGSVRILDFGVAMVLAEPTAAGAERDDVAALGTRLAALFDAPSGPDDRMSCAARELARRASDPDPRRRPASVEGLAEELPSA